MSDNRYFIGLDLGTSVTKGILMDSAGQIHGTEKTDMEYIRGSDGTVEFDAEKYFLGVCSVIKRLAAQVASVSDIAAISMASASGNTVLADKEGKPLANAVSWLDKRENGELSQVLSAPDPDEIHRTVGWPLIPMFPLAHLSWYRVHKPEILDKASTICMSTDYINHRLTGRWGIDESTATTFYLQDQVSRTWNKPLLKKLGISEDRLPPILGTGSVLGSLTSEAAELTGLNESTLVVLGAFDHPCAARGSGNLDEGQLLISCGTSWVGFYPVTDRNLPLSLKMLVDPFLSASDGCYASMFSLPAIGEAVSAYVVKYVDSGPDKYKTLDSQAEKSLPGSGGLYVDPFSPPTETEIISHSSEEISRAVMEGTVYRLKAKIDEFTNAGLRADSITMVGGPSMTMPWPQIVADVTGREISVINGQNAGAYGAALIAAVEIRFFPSLEEAYKKITMQKKTITPDMNAHREYIKHFENFKAKYLSGEV